MGSLQCFMALSRLLRSICVHEFFLERHGSSAVTVEYVAAAKRSAALAMPLLVDLSHRMWLLTCGDLSWKHTRRQPTERVGLWQKTTDSKYGRLVVCPLLALLIRPVGLLLRDDFCQPIMQSNIKISNNLTECLFPMMMRLARPYMQPLWSRCIHRHRWSGTRDNVDVHSVTL